MDTVNGWNIEASPMPAGRLATGWAYRLVDPSSGFSGAEGLGGVSRESALRRGADAAVSAMHAGVSLPEGFYHWHAKGMGALAEHGPMPSAVLAQWMGGPVLSDNLRAIEQLQGWGLVSDGPDVAPIGDGAHVATYYASK